MTISQPSNLWRRIRTVWATVGITATIIFVAWSLIAFRASASARAALRSDDTVRVAHADHVWRFTPVDSSHRSTTALLFFPGALVDPVAYAPIARAAAVAGHRAIIVELPRRAAFGGADDPALLARVDSVLRAGDGYHWIAAGHSRGAVVAAELASRRSSELSGLILLGTTHPRDVDLANLTIPVTKVVGTRDGVAKLADAVANRRLLPASTDWIELDGGNHSQFGWYGFQPGDHRASLTRDAQHERVIGAVLHALGPTPAQ